MVSVIPRNKPLLGIFLCNHGNSMEDNLKRRIAVLLLIKTRLFSLDFVFHWIANSLKDRHYMSI